MSAPSLARLLSLSAIWGASFLFMRIAAPALGPSMLVFARVVLAAIFLLLVGHFFAMSLDTRRHWRHYLVLGLFNSALPFFLFAYAAQIVSASLLSILNATAPIWAAVIAGLWLRTRLSVKGAIGMLLGLLGVGVLARVEALALPAGGGLAIAAGLAAPLCYGIATTYAKHAPAVEPFANAQGSMWAAALFLLPLAILAPPLHALPAPPVTLAVLALGIVCSGVAYLLYFRLIADIGAASALTVTFLIPVFGIFWGVLFLGEEVGWHTGIGSLLVLAGTALVTDFSVTRVFSRRAWNAA